MKLLNFTFLIFLAVIALMVFAAFFPSPLTVFLAASGSAVLVVYQVYAVLRDDGPTFTPEKQPNFPGYQRK
ncbi:MAG: hypothetical protein AAGF89_07785 [Bacteroidota bacterium]